jgi:hypothetical protein
LFGGIDVTDLRGKIKRTIDQTFGPFSDGVVERMAWSISKVPEIAESQARIAELEAALGDMTGLFSADDVLLKGTYLRYTLHQARAALKAKP